MNTRSGTQAAGHKYYHPSDSRSGAKPDVNFPTGSQGDYYHNTTGVNYYGSTKPYVYMYSVGNPASYYDGIELSQTDMQNRIDGNSYITVQDIDFRYSSGDSILVLGGNIHYSHQIVQRCDFSFGGGSILSVSAALRDGYCIQVINHAHDIHIRDCTFTEAWTKHISWQMSGNSDYVYQYRNVFRYGGGASESVNAAWNADHYYWVNNVHYNMGEGLMWNERKNTWGYTGQAMFMLWMPYGSYTNCVLKNNIFYGDSARFQTLQTYGAPTYWDLEGWDIDYNCYYPDSSAAFKDNGTNLTFAQWRSRPWAPDAHSITADPLFMNAAGGDFRLRTSSPCLEAGTYVPGISSSQRPNMGL
jgi:hypothetical protein